MTLVIVIAVLVIAIGGLAISRCTRPANALDGTRWVLIGWSSGAVDPKAFPITANFQSGKIYGVDAVNNYSGQYKAGADGSFSVGALTHTEVASTDRRATLAESVFLGLLPQTRKFVVRNDRGDLSLSDANGKELLIFAAAK
jgi:heat shock protein HslJ